MEDPQETLPAETGGDGAAPQKQTADPLTTISVDQLTSRVKKIRRARAEVMEEDVHFGTIPGTGDKPTLLKPGAETLCNLFQLAPDPDVEIVDMEGDHREYIVRGGLRHIPTGNQVGSGVGSCSTKESKYRYRYIEDATDVSVPGSFWDSGDEMADRDFSILLDALKSEGVPVPDDAEAGVTKEQGQWLITLEGKGENPDLADVYNTCLKMAKKRWLVDVTLTATGASEAFTQDLDDMADLRGTNVGGGRQQKQQTQQQSQPPQKVERYGHLLTPNQAQNIDDWEQKLEETDRLDAAIGYLTDKIKQEIEDPQFYSAMNDLLDEYRGRLDEQDDDTAGKESGGGSGQSQAEAGDAPAPSQGFDKDARSIGDYDTFPTGFPGAVHLKEFGIEKPAHLDQYLDSGDPLTEIDGIGETRAEKIRQSLEDLRRGEFEDEIPF